MASHPVSKPGPSLPVVLPLTDEASSASSHHALTSPSERLGGRTGQSSAVQSRETSAARGRMADAPLSAFASSTLQPQQSRRGQSHSKSPDTTAIRAGPGPVDTGVERRPSNSSYGHHRQTSIVHGFQHSRNPSGNSPSPSASPLSPELIASMGRLTGMDGTEGTGTIRSDSPKGYANVSGPGALGSGDGSQGALSTAEEGKDSVDHPRGTIMVNASHRRLPSNGRTLREAAHSRSHSKHQSSESKTVGEYALHHLFNSVRGSRCSRLVDAAVLTILASLLDKRTVRLTKRY